MSWQQQAYSALFRAALQYVWDSNFQFYAKMFLIASEL
jgi:hypothetical protein